MMTSDLVAKIHALVKEKMLSLEGSHDWYHVERVWETAKLIGNAENANMEIVELAALLHDIADHKYHGGDEEVGPRLAGELLKAQDVDDAVIEHIQEIVGEVSFMGEGEEKKPATLEGQVVQDADRLDAMGAIGVARAFAYGGSKGRKLYDPQVAIAKNMTKAEYKTQKSPSINHFFEKLLLLKDHMNTQTGYTLAIERHMFMVEYLKEFFRELGVDMPELESYDI